MIIITGGAGFIGSALIWGLNCAGEDRILAVDELGHSDKWRNLRDLSFSDYMEKEDLIPFLQSPGLPRIKAILHMGADSSTTQEDMSWLIRNNYEYTKEIALFCARKNIRFIYASSAATYGDGSRGYSDSTVEGWQPMNPYGWSKQLFDQWAFQKGLLNRFVGLKYFNVFGPNESHKGDMRSMVNKAYHQIKETGGLRLFRSHRPDYRDGEQVRDFIYIKDAVQATLHFLNNRSSGIFNIGTGIPRSWNDLARAVFKALDKPEKIEYTDMPDAIRNQYQYHTCADISRLKNTGLDFSYTSLEEAVSDYVINYLQTDKRLTTSS